MLTFDPHDPEHPRTGVPFDDLARIRQEEPVCRTPKGAWYLSRQEEVLEVLKDVESFRADLAPLGGLSSYEDVPPGQWFLSEIPEPRHGKIRRLFNICFGPQRVAKFEPFIRDLCNRLVDDMVANGGGDLHHDYAMPIPSLTMAEVMGLAPEASDRFMEWSMDGSIMQRSTSPGVPAEGLGIRRYFAEQLAVRRGLADPPKDAFSILLDAEIDGEPLSDDEIITQLHFMVQAGVHTTRGLLTHLVQRLLQDPDLYRAVREDRELVAPLVEESLRHDAPVQATTRRCQRDAVVGGVAMHAGDWVQVGIGSANRDETVYEEAESFRLDRPQPRNHLGFGAGSHVCPGATLARIEAVSAVETLLDRVSRLETVAGASYPPVPGWLQHTPIPARFVLAH